MGKSDTDEYRKTEISDFDGKSMTHGSSYTGGLKNGKRHGQGTQICSDGGKYVGEFRDDEFHGQGTFTFPEGMKFSSLTKIYGSHGYGSYVYSDVDKFVGEYKQGKQWEGTLYSRSGTVVATWSEGVEIPE